MSDSLPTRILLVEDDVDDVDVLRGYVRRLPGSYVVEVAYDAGEAVRKAQRPPGFHLALVDQNLPGISGHELISAMHEALPGLPLVMLTGQGDERLAVEVMKAGAYDYLRKHDLDPEGLGRVLRNVLERARLEAEVRSANALLREWAIRDGLTGLFNHRYFQELLHTEFARAQRYGQPLACLMLDLDRFKQINDSFGHPFGDDVLKRLAETLRGQAREVDIVARYGGEEFVAILPATDRAGALQFAERIRAAVEASPFEHQGRSVPATVSIGVATTRDAGAGDEARLVALADAALYEAKRGGRNRVVAHDPGRSTAPPAEPDPALQLGDQFLAGLAAVIQFAEDQSGDHQHDHSRRVAELATRLGERLELSSSELADLRIGALLHDVGRVAIAGRVWSKPGPLTDAEFAQVRRHTTLGAELVRRGDAQGPIRQIVLSHHERWDGAGYPHGLAGTQIPLLARIVTIADVYDALTNARAWREALSAEDAAAILEADAGSAYDPDLVEVFVEHVVRGR